MYIKKYKNKIINNVKNKSKNIIKMRYLILILLKNV